MSDHTARCWGNDCHGQLGDGRTFDCALTEDGSATPIQVSNLSDATTISAGAFHSCAVLGTGKIQCWGVNYHGEFGNGTRTDSAVPQDVVGISTARSVVTGDRHTCALLAEGTVKCWGPNDVGQLGSGAPVSIVDLTLTPVSVVIDTATPPTVLSNIQSIASSPVADTTCAVQVGGAVYCWGDNEYGQLLGATGAYSNIALPAAGIAASAVAVGRKTTCALLTSGAVNCWGQGDSGELGDGLHQHSRTPVTVALSSPALGLAFGSHHGCAILDDANRGLQCWGDNLYSQIGDGTGFNDLYAPVNVKDLSRVTQVSASHGHTCAIVESGALYCWGDDYEDQCGPNSSRNHVNGLGTTPVIVTGF